MHAEENDYLNYNIYGVPFALTQKRNFELSGLFCSRPPSAFKIR